MIFATVVFNAFTCACDKSLINFVASSLYSTNLSFNSKPCSSVNLLVLTKVSIVFLYASSLNLPLTSNDCVYLSIRPFLTSSVILSSSFCLSVNLIVEFVILTISPLISSSYLILPVAISICLIVSKYLFNVSVVNTSCTPSGNALIIWFKSSY